MASNPGDTALAALDGILAAAPRPDQALFSRATHCLSVYRDGLIASGAERRRLAHVNAVISVLLAGHFPLGEVPWAELHRARGWLKEAVLF